MKRFFTVLILMMVAATTVFAEKGLLLDYENKTITVEEMNPEDVFKGEFFYETSNGIFRAHHGRIEKSNYQSSLRDAVTSRLRPPAFRVTASQMEEQLKKLGASEEDIAPIIAQAAENDKAHEELYTRNRVMLTQLDEALNELYGVNDEDWR